MSRPLPSSHRAAALWVITSYYNPAGYRRRLHNYRLFRRHLEAPLLTVEMSTTHTFALKEGDADLLIQCPEGHVMWQKERLLNHALKYLPPACRYVLWADCDVLFGAEDWPQQVEAALERVPLLQPFERVYQSRFTDQINQFHLSPLWKSCPALEALMRHGTRFEDCVNTFMMLHRSNVCVGMAWAARRELLEKHGLYDRTIIGGGDTALVCASQGRPDIVMDLHFMNPRQRETYQAWAVPFYKDVQGHISHIPGQLIHLWHGDLRDRRGSERHSGLAPYQFDPTQDIALSPHGTWRWSSDKPDLHAYLKSYFASRHEDGYVPFSAYS